MLVLKSILLGLLIFMLIKPSLTCLSTQFSANGVCYACSVTCLTCTSSTTTSCSTCSATRFLNGQTACQCNDGYVQNSPATSSCQKITCSYTCLTCNNTATTCSTCKSTDNRIFVSSSLTCPCIAKYYDNGAATCAACHYTCGQCTGTTSSTCTFCDTSAYRTLSSTSCPCNNGYYDVSVYTCAACNHACATCVTSANNCQICGANRGSAPTCTCSTGYYDDGISTPCIACNISCNSCSNGTSCDTCSSANFRVLTSLSSFCVCMNRYFDAGMAACSPCDPRCFTCLSATVCLTCTATAFRTFQSSTKTCVCMTGYYETSTTVQLCAKCDSRCLTCSGSSTNCLTCDNTMNRITDSAGGCPCKTGFFENAYLTCSACDSSCYTCTVISACTACVAASLRVINSSGLCSCSSNMYYNTTLNMCQGCSYKCATCQITSPTACLSCPASSQRTFSSLSCPCNNYFYDDGSASTCKACHYSCLTCSSNLVTACLSCTAAANRYLTSGSCLCKTYFYDNGALELCQPCKYNCLTCVDAVSCSTCDPVLFRTLNTTASPNTCSCALYYFENVSLKCQLCLYSCYTCNINTKCLTCDLTTNHRIFNVTTELCDCIPGYYDNFVDRTCLPCLPQCYICTNATTCTTCSSALMRELSTTNRCPCKDPYFDVSGVCTGCLYYCLSCSSPSSCVSCNATAYRLLNSASQCICSDNYFDDGSKQLCLPCSYACLTCVNTEQKCVTCDTTLRVLSSNWCACPQHFYDNNVTVACVACHYTCSSCLQGSKCKICDASKFRIFDSVNQYCICQQGYYDDLQNQLCKACNMRCKTCTNSSVCLTCNPASNRFTPSSICPCLDGYYDDNSHQTCPSCHYTCKTCIKGTQCLSCQAITNKRTFDTDYLCKCIGRFYDDGANNQKCLPCVYSCLTCSGSSITCTTCNTTAYRELVGSKCDCLQRYYDNLKEQCLPCHYTCLTCTSPLLCTSCSTSLSRVIDPTSGYCSCLPMFWDNGSKQKCNNCHPTCLICKDTLNCVSCDPARNRMLNSSIDIYGTSSPFCVCYYRHYSLGDNNMCKPCHYSCQVCKAGDRSGCIICNTTSLRHFVAATTSCLCNDGYYDNNITEECQVCNAACTLCTTGLPNSCTACSPLYYLLLSKTTCYTTCPDFYYNYQIDFTCKACSLNCQVCLNSSYCSKCATGSLLYKQACVTTCPDGTFAVVTTSGGICNDCPNGCKTCKDTTMCLSCMDNYYFSSSLGFCFSCNTVCLTCSGPGQNQCLSCASPLFLSSTTCTVLSCSLGYYVDPKKGCKSCSQLFIGSINCNSTNSFSCKSGYKLVNNSQCVSCNSITGYTVSNGECKQICGDGILIYLQCDDGNNRNGDGCSENCLIQNGWTCTSDSPSACSLKGSLQISMIDYEKVGGANSIILYLNLSIPIILVQSKFSLAISTISSSLFSYNLIQDSKNLSKLTLSLSYKTDLQNKNLQISYTPSRRLEQSNQQFSSDQASLMIKLRPRMLITGPFTASLGLNIYPPATYYPDTTIGQFSRLKDNISALAIALLVLCLILVPKKMHLHSVTLSYLPAQIFITYGIVAEGYTDWIKYCLESVKSTALFGGISFGECCSSQSTFFEITTEIFKQSFYLLFALIIIQAILLILHYLNSNCIDIKHTLKTVSYFAFTLNLVLIFSLIYTGINSLYQYTLLTPADTFNNVLGVFINLAVLLALVGLWVITYLTQPPIAKNDRRIYVHDKQVVFDVPVQSEENTVDIGRKKSMELASQLNSQTSKDLGMKQQQQINSSDNYVLSYDYLNLYNHVKRVSLNGQSRMLIKKSKYFLPLLMTKLYLTAILSSLLQSEPFYLFIILSGLEVNFIIFVITVRPFQSKFTNIRLIIVSLLLIACNSVMSAYIHQSKEGNYNLFLEKLAIYFILAILASATLFVILQHLLSWRKEVWSIIQPCLKGSRLMGHRAIKFSLQESESSMRKSDSFKGTKSNLFRQTGYSNYAEQIDAFYARMLKKDQLNKEYRRQRMIK